MELELTEDLSIKNYEGLSEEWLLMVQKNRTLGGLQHTFDIVQGPVANDKTARTIALYIAGIINANEAIERLQFNQINNQVSFHTPAALSHLKMVRKYQK
jgi:glutamine synthetase type III